jgi:FAD dependent oxidoreductase
MKRITYLIIVLISLASCKKENNTLFIEAESFDEKGGWVVDPQFVEQMGSPYLLAHGLGTPVANAKTEVNFAETGTYYIWVRTMNWAPGKWKAPGTFHLIINQNEINKDLGTETGWNWQYVGKMDISNKKNIIELKDLTGFEGRCDAIYFSSNKQTPPRDNIELASWRKKQLKESDTPSQSQAFDLVIVGGGIAGCAAAISAAEQGLKVALVHDRPVLGGNASNEIRVHTLGITWHYERILSMLNTEHYPNGSPKALQEDIKRLNNIKKYNHISLFLSYRAYATNTINDSITSVDARNITTNKTIRFIAPYFIDCTGDGWIGYWAGADYIYGREDSLTYGENWPKHAELWSPGKPDNRVMGSSVLWRSVDIKQAYTFPDVPWAMETAKDYSEINGEWFWEFSSNELHQINDAEQIRDHMFKAIYGSFYNAKQKPANANIKLEWVSYLLGKRESRRLMGDYIYTFNDEKEMREFNDAVVMEKREIDVHYQENLRDTTLPDFLSKALFYKVDHYYLPYRCLYSRNIKNLFMAGRCFSCSHVGLGGPRVMNTTGQMGAAVGYASSLCVKYKTNPRAIYNNHIDELKELILNSNNCKP